MIYVAVLLALSLSTGDSEVALSGAVVDPDGSPVGGAEVFLSDGPPVSPRLSALFQGQVPIPPDVIGRARSDDAGAFTIRLKDDARESSWAQTWLVLWIRRPGSALATYLVGRNWPARTPPVDVRLADAPPISLVVAAPDGKPVKLARVLPEQVNDARLPYRLAEQFASTTDGRGRAELREIDPQGLDLVRIETAEYGIQWASLPAVDVDGARRIVLAPVGTVRGRLTADDPRAVQAVPIRLATWLTAGDDAAGGGLAETITDATGNFEVPALAAGALSAVPELQVDLPFRCLQATGRPVAAATTNELTIALERAVRVEGVVQDRDHRNPIAGVGVLLDYQESLRRAPRTDEQGRYAAFLLPGQTSPLPLRVPRNYYFPLFAIDRQPVPTGAAQVELKPLLLARGITLRGRVLDRNGHGVAGTEVRGSWALAAAGEISLQTWSDRDGDFTLEGVDPQAQLQLSAYSAVGTTAAASSVLAGAEKPVELVVDPSHALHLEGRVLDAQRRPVAGASVRIAWQRRDANGRADDNGYAYFAGGLRLLTDADGQFRTPNVLLRGLEYRAEVTAPGLMPALTEFIDPLAWQTVALGDIVLPDLPTTRPLEGRLVDSHGMPLSGLRVFQTGDGPQRTETTTDDDGRFYLTGVYEGPVFLLVTGERYPLQGFLVDHDGRSVEVVARRANEPAWPHLQTLKEPLTSSERRDIGLRLIEPLLPSLTQDKLEREKVWLLRTLATLDATRVAEFSKLPMFREIGLGDEANYAAASALVQEDLAEALALGEAIGEPHYRGRVYLAACDALSDNERGRKAEFLATALLHARAESDVAQRVELTGKIAERWLDLGEVERGTVLLREGERLAEQLPPPSEAAERAHELAPHLRASFAGSLARIDGLAAIKLSAGFNRFADRYRIVVARGLAGHDPEAAERMLEELEFSNSLYPQALPVLHRMAGVDPQRAARLARKCEKNTERGYALGVVAHGVARHDTRQAATILNEAYELLERAAAEGAVNTATAYEHPAVLAAALLPVAESVEPALVGRYFWRAMALRSPRAARIRLQDNRTVATGALAIFVSRYDREAARVLADPIARQVQSLAAEGDEYWEPLVWATLGAVDAVRAESLMETLPEPPPLALRAAKNVARRSLADGLAPSAGGWWHKLYGNVPTLRDPGARDDEE